MCAKRCESLHSCRLLCQSHRAVAILHAKDMAAHLYRLRALLVSRFKVCCAKFLRQVIILHVQEEASALLQRKAANLQLLQAQLCVSRAIACSAKPSFLGQLLTLSCIACLKPAASA